MLHALGVSMTPHQADETNLSMNPGEAPEAAVNGQTTAVQPPSSAALKNRSKPKKGEK